MRAKYKPSVLFPLFFLFSLPLAFALPEKANTSSKSEKIIFASTDDDRAFLSAAKRGDCSEVERLLNAGVFVDVRDLSEEGNTALILAAGNGRKDAAEILIERGAEIDARQIYHGRTALTEAVKNGKKDAAELLIEHGADVNAIAYHGAFVLDWAVENNDGGMVELLREHGAVTGFEGYKVPSSYEKAHSYRTGKPYEKMKNVPDEIERYRESDPERFVRELCSLIEMDAKDDFEKVKMAHDYIACNIRYGSNSKRNSGWNYVLKEKKGICRGYTNLLKKMLDVMEIPNVKDSGYARTRAPTIGYEKISNDHIWNMVQIYGEWYLVDVTWDNNPYSTTHLFPTPEAYRYSRFPWNNASQQLMPKIITRREFLNLPYFKVSALTDYFSIDSDLKLENVVDEKSGGKFTFVYTLKKEGAWVSFEVFDEGENKIKDAYRIARGEDNPDKCEAVFSFGASGLYRVKVSCTENWSSWYCGEFYCDVSLDD